MASSDDGDGHDDGGGGGGVKAIIRLCVPIKYPSDGGWRSSRIRCERVQLLLLCSVRCVVVAGGGEDDAEEGASVEQVSERPPPPPSSSWIDGHQALLRFCILQMNYCAIDIYAHTY